MSFAYHRSLTPMLAVLLGLACVEALVMHLVAIAYWGWKVALVLGAVDLSMVLLLVRLLRSFRRAPITVEDGLLTMRTGHRLHVPVALDNIAGFRDQWTGAELKAPHVLNMALITWPNVVLELRQPVALRRRRVTAIAHCVDDPAAFRDALLRSAPPA